MHSHCFYTCLFMHFFLCVCVLCVWCMDEILDPMCLASWYRIVRWRLKLLCRGFNSQGAHEALWLDELV